jgi:MSHA biogenesis protein MshP
VSGNSVTGASGFGTRDSGFVPRLSIHDSRLTSQLSRLHSASGFTLVAALFLIVVVAALGAFAVRISSGQQQTVNLALLSARALAAANSGIEFGAYQALNGTGCASATLNLTEAGLNGFTVNVSCTATVHTESGGTVNVYRIDATSSAGTYGKPDYVSRHVYATFTSAT